MMHPDIARALTSQHNHDMMVEANKLRAVKQARRRQATPNLTIPTIPDTVAELFGDQPQRHVTTR
jgi:hypothetical protein